MDIIFFDIDNVLCKTISIWLPYFNRDFKSSVKYEDIFDYGITLPGFKNNEPLNHLISFCTSERVKQFQAEGIESIRRLSKKYILYSLTDRFLSLKEVSLEWINLFYGNHFKDVIFSKELSMTKTEICLDLMPLAIIEDASPNILSISKAGFNVLMMDCPWNFNISETINRKRIFGIEDVEKIVCGF